jgi:cell wall-associated NlpC family hydrolase
MMDDSRARDFGDVAQDVATSSVVSCDRNGVKAAEQRGMMSRWPFLRGCALALPSGLLAACAQGTYGISNRDVLSTIILVGEAVGASTGSATPSGTARRIPSSPAPTAAASRILNTADQYIGVKYTWGGNTPQGGFDCSGFTKFVFAKEGVALPRTAREQAKVGRAVSRDFSAFQPGDLLFFAEPGESISHVAIYVGNGEIIHASSGYGAVNYLDLSTSRGDWYVQNLAAVRRMLPAGR